MQARTLNHGQRAAKTQTACGKGYDVCSHPASSFPFFAGKQACAPCLPQHIPNPEMRMNNLIAKVSLETLLTWPLYHTLPPSPCLCRASTLSPARNTSSCMPAHQSKSAHVSTSAVFTCLRPFPRAIYCTSISQFFTLMITAGRRAPLAVGALTRSPMLCLYSMGGRAKRQKHAP